MRKVQGVLAAIGAAGLFLVVPAAAWACPVCAGRETDTSLVLGFVGLMIAVPYGVSVVAIRVIRKADKESAWLHPPIADESKANRS